MLPFSDKLLEAVTQLEIRSRRPIASLLAGDYRSPFRGSGMQFKEFRHYEPGDDIRHMSWAVTARTGRSTVKTFEEERELNVVALVDVSGSTLFGSEGVRKIDMFAEITALIGLGAVQSGDPFGLLLFSDCVPLYLPPRRSQDHVRLALLRLLQQPLKGCKSDLEAALIYLQRVLKTRSLLLIVSDFLVPSFWNPLRAAAQRHDIVLVHGYDQAERNSLQGIYPVWDPETGQHLLLDGNSRAARSRLEAFQNRLAGTLEDNARACGADYVSLNSGEDYLKALVTFFRRRPRR